jgi:spermidine synthase
MRLTPPRPRAALAALCLLLAAYWAWSALGSRVIFEGESAFGRVRVVERADGLRELRIGPGRARQSALYPGRPEHLELAYSRVATVGLALVPADARVLYVGLGGGAMPIFARRMLPDARVEVVEIDPLVVEVAQRFFGFRPDARLAVHTADGREWIERAPPGSWDLVVLDAFSDDEIPSALTTREFLEAVRRALAPGGVVVSNLWTSVPEYPSMLATYRAVFGEVRLIRVSRRAQRVLVATPGSRGLDRDALVAASDALARRAGLPFDLPRLVREGYEGVPEPDAPVLEDSLTPPHPTR